jgi:DNA-binding LacI/PurR family transcriptional regulator
LKSFQQPGSVQSTKQLADYLGLSRWTVSRVLNGHAEVNDATAERVREAAKDLGFSPNLLAQGLRRGRTRMVGVILPDLVTFNLTAKIEHVQRRLSEMGYQTLFSLVEKNVESNRQALQHFISMRVAGLITFAADWEARDPWVQGLAREKVPVVHVDPMRAEYGMVVRTDREHAMKQVLEYLYGLGHRKIAVAGVDPEGLYGRQRLKGLKASALDLGLDWGREITLIPMGRRNPSDFEFGADLALDLIGMKPAPTAVIALNDQIAFGMLSVLREKKLRVPGQFSLVGYDNEEFSAYADPALTTVDPRIDDLMDKAVDYLFEKESAKNKRETRLKPKLILRGSTARPKGKKQDE